MSDDNLNKEIEEGLARADAMLRKQRLQRGLLALVVVLVLAAGFVGGRLTASPPAPTVTPTVTASFTPTVTLAIMPTSTLKLAVTATPFPSLTVTLTADPQPPKLLFVSETINQNVAFYTLDIETHVLEKLFDIRENGHVYSFSLSPDKNKIAFSLDQKGFQDIYTVNIDGSNLKKLNDHPATDDAPVWSPDGKEIAFMSDRKSASEYQLFIIDSTGENLRGPLTGPLWSSNGWWAQLAPLQWAPDEKILINYYDSSKYFVDPDVNAAQFSHISADCSSFRGINKNGKSLIGIKIENKYDFKVLKSDGSEIASISSDLDNCLGLDLSSSETRFVVAHASGEPRAYNYTYYSNLSISVFDINLKQQVMTIDVANPAKSLLRLGDVFWFPDEKTIFLEKWDFTGKQINGVFQENEFFQGYSIDGSKLFEINLSDMSVDRQSRFLWSPDGTKLIFHARDGFFYDFNAKTLKLEKITPTSISASYDIYWLVSK